MRGEWKREGEGKGEKSEEKVIQRTRGGREEGKEEKR